jgi:AraC-like DNA-binding protein
MRAPEEPTVAGSRPNGSLRLDRQARVEGIYTFFYQEREQGFIFSGEEHPMPELTYVDQGELHTVADGQDILLKQGEIAFKGPNQWHMDYADMGVAPRYVTITFDLEGVDITPLLNRKFAAPQSAVTLIQHMLREQERMDAYSQDMILSYLSALVLTILRHADAPEAKLKASNSVHSENEIIRRAQQYISGHIREKLSVPLVARMVDVSPSYLTALFHKNLQISPGEYIRRIKLQESKQMIREGNLNFTEIAAALQYSTVHHFSRQFKEKFGITPTEYAKSVR